VDRVLSSHVKTVPRRMVIRPMFPVEASLKYTASDPMAMSDAPVPRVLQFRLIEPLVATRLRYGRSKQYTHRPSAPAATPLGVPVRG
jgi:hypothetical protein